MSIRPPVLLADGEPGPSFNAIVESAARAAASLVGNAADWWTVPSTSLLQTDVFSAQNALRPLLLVVLAASVLVQGIRIVVSRKGEPAIAVAGGLLRFVLAAALGVTVLQCALLAGDALATTLVGDSAHDFGAIMRDALTTRRDGLAEPFLLLLLSGVVLALAAAQWMAMALRQVALLAVAATLPLAAAGSLTAATRSWLSRLLPWGLALVIYKPAAALIHAVGRQYLVQIAAGAGSGVAVVLTGIVVLGLGVAALPVSLRLLSTVSGVRVAGGGIGGDAMSGAVGAVRRNGRSTTSPSVQLATFMESAGPGSSRRLFHGASASAPAAGAGTGYGTGYGTGTGALPGIHPGIRPASEEAASRDPFEPAERSLLEPWLTSPIPRVTDRAV
jgi:hypothetical protein